MLTFLPGPILGILSLLLYIANTILIPGLVFIGGLIMLITPSHQWRLKIEKFMQNTLVIWWVDISNFIMWLTTKTKWDVQGTGNLSRNNWYFVVSNHQSWLDIIVLEKIFARKIPMMKFFMKKELLWTLPIAGWACWLLDYPFVERYSKDYLKKHPEKMGKDLEITKRACEKFKHQPISVINYIEGTRFTKQKQKNQSSPYKHLLKPKAGGFSFVLNAMGDQLDSIINVTIIYPDPDASLWKFMCGKMKKIIVRYEVIPVTPALIGDYYQDQAFRKEFHRWVNALWQEKEALIEQTLQQSQTQ